MRRHWAAIAATATTVWLGLAACGGEPIDSPPGSPGLDEDSSTPFATEVVPAGTPATAAPPAGTVWRMTQIGVTEHGDMRVAAAFATDASVVMTGALTGPTAEALGGPQPLAWYSSDAEMWEMAPVEPNPDASLTAFELGPVFSTGEALMAFGAALEPETQRAGSALFASDDDGRTWQQLTDEGAPRDGFVADVVAGGPGFVAVGYSSNPPNLGGGATIWSSANGLAWDPIAAESIVPGAVAYGAFAAVAERNGTLVAAGATYDEDEGAPRGEVWISTDGLAWSRQPGADIRFAGISDVVATPSGFVAVGSARPEDAAPEPPLAEEEPVSSAWFSGDGMEWTRIEMPASQARAVTRVALVGDRLVAIGDGTDHAVAWESTDGRSWELLGNLPGGGAASAVTGLRERVIVGGASAEPRQAQVWISPP